MSISASVWRLSLVLFCLIGLSSCRLGGQRRTDPPPPVTPSPANAVPTEAVTPPAEATATIPAIVPLQFVQGRNEYILDVDGKSREFIVYVPSGYDSNLPTPVVYVIHGSNMSGQKMYENTHWARKADEENIIIVYPTSWKYRTTEANRIEDKWNTPGTEQILAPGQELEDDVKFMRMILESLQVTFNIDGKRIFASGFSNGGGFVITRLIPDMNDVIAAYSTAGAGLLGEATASSVPVQVSASLYSIIGTNDDRIAEGQGISTPFPLDEQEIINDATFGPMLERTTAFLNLDMTYTLESDPRLTRFTFANSPLGAGNEYIFLMLKGIHHVYPDGADNPAGIDGADEFWDFFLEHSKP